MVFCLSTIPVQVNLFQKPSFLHQLTHNMTRDCSLNSPKNTSVEHVVYINCFFVFVLIFKTIFVTVNLFQKPSFFHQLTHNMTRDCSLNSPECFCFDTQNNTCTQLVLNLYFSGDSTNNLPLYCGLTD